VRESSFAGPVGYVALALGLALGCVSLLVGNSAGTLAGALMCAGGAGWFPLVRPPAEAAHERTALDPRWLAAASTLVVAALAAYLAIELQGRGLPRA